MTDEKEEITTTEAVIGCLNFLLLPVYFLWSGYVLMRLWGWFLVPLGLPGISIAEAAGLGVIVSFVTSRAQVKAPPSINILTTETLGPLIALVAGWGIKHFL